MAGGRAVASLPRATAGACGPVGVATSDEGHGGGGGGGGGRGSNLYGGMERGSSAEEPRSNGRHATEGACQPLPGQGSEGRGGLLHQRGRGRAAQAGRPARLEKE